MEKYSKTKRNDAFVEIAGTRYYRVVLISQETVEFMGLVSTPLSNSELIGFIEDRIGSKYTANYVSFVTEVKGAALADQQVTTKVMGLSTFEEKLRPFVPEVILEERTYKYVHTNKGVRVEEVTKEGE